MANIAAQRIKREFKEVIKSEEVSFSPLIFYHERVYFTLFSLPPKHEDIFFFLFSSLCNSKISSETDGPDFQISDIHHLLSLIISLFPRLTVLSYFIPIPWKKRAQIPLIKYETVYFLYYSKKQSRELLTLVWLCILLFNDHLKVFHFLLPPSPNINLNPKSHLDKTSLNSFLCLHAQIHFIWIQNCNDTVAISKALANFERTMYYIYHIPSFFCLFTY